MLSFMEAPTLYLCTIITEEMKFVMNAIVFLRISLSYIKSVKPPLDSSSALQQVYSKNIKEISM